MIKASREDSIDRFILEQNAEILRIEAKLTDYRKIIKTHNEKFESWMARFNENKMNEQDSASVKIFADLAKRTERLLWKLFFENERCGSNKTIPNWLMIYSLAKNPSREARRRMKKLSLRKRKLQAANSAMHCLMRASCEAGFYLNSRLPESVDEKTLLSLAS